MSKLYHKRGLSVGAPILVRGFDHLSGHDVWSESRVRARVSNGYLIDGMYGSSFVDDEDRGRTWKAVSRR
jgi:hypothetical protein